MKSSKINFNHFGSTVQKYNAQGRNKNYLMSTFPKGQYYYKKDNSVCFPEMKVFGLSSNNYLELTEPRRKNSSENVNHFQKKRWNLHEKINLMEWSAQEQEISKPSRWSFIRFKNSEEITTLPNKGGFLFGRWLNKKHGIKRKHRRLGISTAKSIRKIFLSGSEHLPSYTGLPTLREPRRSGLSVVPPVLGTYLRMNGFTSLVPGPHEGLHFSQHWGIWGIQWDSPKFSKYRVQDLTLGVLYQSENSSNQRFPSEVVGLWRSKTKVLTRWINLRGPRNEVQWGSHKVKKSTSTPNWKKTFHQNYLFGVWSFLWGTQNRLKGSYKSRGEVPTTRLVQPLISGYHQRRGFLLNRVTHRVTLHGEQRDKGLRLFFYKKKNIHHLNKKPLLTQKMSFLTKKGFFLWKKKRLFTSTRKIQKQIKKTIARKAQKSKKVICLSSIQTKQKKQLQTLSNLVILLKVVTHKRKAFFRGGWTQHNWNKKYDDHLAWTYYYERRRRVNTIKYKAKVLTFQNNSKTGNYLGYVRPLVQRVSRKRRPSHLYRRCHLSGLNPSREHKLGQEKIPRGVWRILQGLRRWKYNLQTWNLPRVSEFRGFKLHTRKFQRSKFIYSPNYVRRYRYLPFEKNYFYWGSKMKRVNYFSLFSSKKRTHPTQRYRFSSGTQLFKKHNRLHQFGYFTQRAKKFITPITTKKNKSFFLGTHKGGVGTFFQRKRQRISGLKNIIPDSQTRAVRYRSPQEYSVIDNPFFLQEEKIYQTKKEALSLTKKQQRKQRVLNYKIKKLTLSKVVIKLYQKNKSFFSLSKIKVPKQIPTKLEHSTLEKKYSKKLFSTDKKKGLSFYQRFLGTKYYNDVVFTSISKWKNLWTHRGVPPGDQFINMLGKNSPYTLNTQIVRLYYLFGTSLGMRSKRKGGSYLKLPKLVQTQQSWTRVRRWFTQACTATGLIRTWKERVYSEFDRPRKLQKLRDDHVRSSLRNRAYL